MADIILYEEVPRPYKPPPPMVDRTHIQGKSLKDKDKVRAEVVDFFRVLRLVLDPLAMQIRYLRRQVNMDDLLRKLKWYTVLFKPIVEMDIFTPAEQTAFWDFEEQVNKLLGRQGISEENFDPISGTMPVIPITDLLMGVCFDARPWTTIDDFYQQLKNHPLSSWPGEWLVYGLSRSLHARVTRMSTGRFLFLGSTRERFPKSRHTEFLWDPLRDWCGEHRMSRLRPGEQKAYESAFRAYNQALEHANIDRNAMNHKPYSLTAADIEGFRRVIQGSHMTMLALPTDDDVGLAMDVKMEIKDACARCLAQRLGGTRLFGQRRLEESLTSGDRGFWQPFSCMSCGEIITNAFACRVARAMYFIESRMGEQAAE